jgi:plastocyanin
MHARVTFVVLATAVGVAVLLQAPALATEHLVEMVGTSFQPQSITIQQGDAVRWRNTAPIGHTTTSGTLCSPDGLWDSGLLFMNDEFVFTFNNAGTFPYFCIPHCLCCAMMGTIIVEAPPADCLLNCPAQDGGVIAAGAGPSNKSPDIDGSGQIDLVDISLFAQAFPPNPYDFCVDFNCDGAIGLVDLANFAIHFGHAGPQLGVCQ